MSSPTAPKPSFIAVVGGSAAGKTRLAEQLESDLAPQAVRLGLDEFYRDLSHLPQAERDRVNFDVPSAVDWNALRAALRSLERGEPTRLPQYDFPTHTRKPGSRLLEPRPVIILDGLWLLHLPWLRRKFRFSLYVDCPPSERLSRRTERDVRERGRRPGSVRRQFQEQVLPMHDRFVEPQRAWATQAVSSPTSQADYARLLRSIRLALAAPPSPSPGRAFPGPAR